MEKKKDITNTTVDILICNHCFVIANASAFRYGLDIQNATESVYQFKKEEVSQLDGQIKQQQDLLSYALPFIKKVDKKTFLEVGFGKGLMLIAASQLGFQRVIGIDPFDNVFRQVSFYFPDVTNISTYHALAEISEQVDFVFMWHTLEHLADPHLFLTEMTKILNPSALFFFQVPQYHSPYIVRTHYYYYNEPSIHYLLSSFGFSILETGYDLDNQFITVVARYSK